MATPLELLTSIDASLKALLALQRGAQPKPIASDADLDGQYGDPEIRAKDPRDWSGPTMKGKTMSQCPAPYLDLLADRLDYFAEKAEENGDVSPNTGKPTAPYLHRDAARARGWSRRIKAGWKPPVTEPDPFAVTADQIPFAGQKADDDFSAF
jgi:hypothetical protein